MPGRGATKSNRDVRVMRVLNGIRIGNSGRLGRIGPRLVEWYFWRFVYRRNGL